MITSGMSAKDVFNEFEKDRKELYERFGEFISANRKSLARDQKGDGDYVHCHGIRRFSVNGNRYRAKLEINFAGDKVNVSSVIYLILKDNTVFLLGGEKNLIVFTQEFFEDLKRELGLPQKTHVEIVDWYMRKDKTYGVSKTKSGFLVNFGNGWLGTANLDEKNNILKITHFKKTQETENP